MSTADRVRDEADVAVKSISTWSKASRDVVRLRKEQFRLRRERDAKIRELGVSFYAEDGRADELKASAKESTTDARATSESCSKPSRAPAAGDERRAAVVATEVIEPEEESAEEPEAKSEKS